MSELQKVREGYECKIWKARNTCSQLSLTLFFSCCVAVKCKFYSLIEFNRCDPHRNHLVYSLNFWRKCRRLNAHKCKICPQHSHRMPKILWFTSDVQVYCISLKVIIQMIYARKAIRKVYEINRGIADITLEIKVRFEKIKMLMCLILKNSPLRNTWLSI